MFEWRYQTPKWVAGTQGDRVITYQTDVETLDEILDEFSDFLRGCGFEVDGDLDVVDDDHAETLQ